jgi:hypothetical protein
LNGEKPKLNGPLVHWARFFFVIENGARRVAFILSAEPLRGRAISECIALAEAHAKELGYEPTMDPDFAVDLERIINSRKPRNVSIRK